MNRTITVLAMPLLLILLTTSPVWAQNAAYDENFFSRHQFFYLAGGMAAGEYLEVEDDLEDVHAASSSPTPRRNDPTRIPIQPPAPSQKIEWMKAFIAEGGHDEAVIEALNKGLAAENPPPVLGDVLNANPEMRDAWYLYRTDRLREMIGEWLTANDIEPIDPPPWKS